MMSWRGVFSTTVDLGSRRLGRSGRLIGPSARLLTARLRDFLIIMTVAAFGATAAVATENEPGCRPEVAFGPALIGKARFLPANLQKNEVRLTFAGHSTFLIESPAGVRIATDYNDYVRAGVTPDIATMNKAHSTHYSNNPEPGIRHVLKGWNPSGGKITHDLTDQDVRIRNVPTNIREWGGGRTDYDGNSIFVFEIADVCIVHLGHLHHTLTPEHLRAIGRADVVLVPVDGSWTLDIDGMIEVLDLLQAKLVVPMHYFGQSTLNSFLARTEKRYVIERSQAPSIVLSTATLPKRPTMLVLPGR
jgi:L-ascorbate metabolism protein UlaG (beta-lactamase superfamily)